MNSPFLLIVGLLACIVRFSIISIEEKYLLLIMAMINIVALDYVLLILFQDAKKLVKEKMENNHMPPQRQKRNIRKLDICYSIFYFIIFVVIGVIYVCFFHSSACNDAISIMALVTSISSNRISIHLSNFMYKIL